MIIYENMGYVNPHFFLSRSYSLGRDDNISPVTSTVYHWGFLLVDVDHKSKKTSVVDVNQYQKISLVNVDQ